MAVFKRLNSYNGYSIYDGRQNYEVSGKLTEEDINWINNIKYTTVKLKFANTKDLDSYTISRINNENVLFSIDGGDPRYNESRKEITSLALATVLYYFETIEQEIDPNWTQIQKAMYIHNVMCTDFKYTEKIEEDLTSNDLCRSLTGILYGQLTCAGFATVYKEFMDRLGITCYFEGVENTHRYNVLNIDGKYYGIDTTWDNNDNKGRKISFFNNFGTDERFYYHHGHIPGHYVSGKNRIDEETAKKVKDELGIDIPVNSLFDHYNDIMYFIKQSREWDHLKDEEIIKRINSKLIISYRFDRNKEGQIFIPDMSAKKFPLSFLTREEIEKNLKEIEQSLLTRKSKMLALNLEDENTRKRYLPNVYDYDNEQIDKMPNHELDPIIKIIELFKMIHLLKDYNLDNEFHKSFMETFRSTYSIALDINPKSRNEYILDINGLKFERHRNIYDEVNELVWGYEGFNQYNVNTKEKSLPLVLKAKDDIDSKLTEYTKQSIDYTIDNFDQLIEKYNTPTDNEDDRNNISERKAVIYSYFQLFIYHEDELLKFDYRQEEVKETARKLKEMFKEKPVSIEKIINNEKDFLYAAFENMSEVKVLLEQHENAPLTDEEFLSKLYDINYLKQALDLSNYHLSDDDYHQLFDEILSNQKNTQL